MTRREQAVVDLLASVSTEDIEEELDRRACAGQKTRDYRPRAERSYCDDAPCRFLKYINIGTEDIDAVCHKGHAIVSRLPANDSEAIDNDCGFHRKDRRKCRDFRSVAPPSGPEGQGEGR